MGNFSRSETYNSKTSLLSRSVKAVIIARCLLSQSRNKLVTNRHISTVFGDVSRDVRDVSRDVRDVSRDVRDVSRVVKDVSRDVSYVRKTVTFSSTSKK